MKAGIKVLGAGLFIIISLTGCNLAPQTNTFQKDETVQQTKNEPTKKEPAPKEEDTKHPQPQPKSEPVAASTPGIQSIFNEYWLQFLGVILSIVGVVLAISGFSLSNNKKKKFLKKLFHEIDDAYGSYKQTNRQCEAELLRLQSVVDGHLKDGSIDENTYQLLERRIDKYLAEIRESHK